MSNDTVTIQIPLTKGFVATVDEIDADLAKFKWHALWQKGAYYAARRDSSRKYILLHRVIFERKYGYPSSKDNFADHVDCNRFNNCRSNIRQANYSESSCNRKSIKPLGFKGIMKRGRKWVATICKDKIIYRLGSFATQKEAYEAYIQAAKELHGEFARWD